jgi:hypothetical protein
MKQNRRRRISSVGTYISSALHIETSSNSIFCNRAFSNTDFLQVDEQHLDL